MRGIEEWKKDFKEYINGLSLPRDDYKGIMEYIDEVPTVDAVQYTLGYQDGFLEGKKICERPQGEWIKHIDNLFPEESTEECPFCHEEQRIVGNDDNFCPNCGADMRGDKDGK
jgi:RNA polymerase subunit RPABC4/transcription elongation factor Spt4